MDQTRRFQIFQPIIFESTVGVIIIMYVIIIITMEGILQLKLKLTYLSYKGFINYLDLKPDYHILYESQSCRL